MEPFLCSLLFPSPFSLSFSLSFFSYLSLFLFPLKKQRREVSINRPASYEPAALPLRHPAYLPFSPLSLLFLVPSLLSEIYILKRFHCRESNPGRKRERLACYQLHHNGLILYPLLSFLSFFSFPSLLLLILLPFLCLLLVSWCSWLSHHFHVVRVPGSNPGGTIFILHNQSDTILFIPFNYIITDHLPIYFIYIQYNPCNYNFFPFYRLIILIFLFVSFKKAAEGSFDQPTCKL